MTRSIHRPTHAKHTQPPLFIDTPDRDPDGGYQTLELCTTSAPLGAVSITVLCITTAIASFAAGVFAAALYYT